MKKIITMLSLMMISTFAYAGSSSQATVSEEAPGIVTPEVATGVWRTYRHISDRNMNVLICPKNMSHEQNITSEDTCKDRSGKMAWVRMENAVPPGKKYVGFKSITQNGSHYIEIYWKDVKQ